MVHGQQQNPQPLVVWVPWMTNLSLPVLCRISSALYGKKHFSARSKSKIFAENSVGEQLITKYIFLLIFNNEVERPREITLLASYQEAAPVFLGGCLELLENTSSLWPRPS